MNTVIFDLDGTLLPMPSQEFFLETYFKSLARKIISHGLEPQKLIKAVWAATGAMIKNDGTMTNEQRFWKVFGSLTGEEAGRLEPVFDHFYRNEFMDAKTATATHPHAAECIRILKEKGYQVVLATNPLFPRVATFTRMEWAGLKPEDFELVTTYENSSYCKPNLEYYREVLQSIGKKPEECVMVGNDVREDMCAAKLGMDTYLLKDCLICSEEEDLSGFRQGNFDELLEMVKALPAIN
jgi:FMN phosphatase YigB (HAD superfamily)